MKNSKSKRKSVSLIDLLEAGSHFGHQVRRWNPRMHDFIWKAQGGIHIFDLAITSKKIDEAVEACIDLVKSGKKIVFVGSKRQARDIIKTEATRADTPYVNTRWPGGLISNWRQISKSIKLLKDLKKDREEGKFDKYTKKENVLIERKITRLKRLFGGLVQLEKEPDAIFVVDTLREKTAIREARIKKIPVFAIVDSNSDPTLVDYPIPANDDAVRSIKLIVTQMSDAVISGKQMQKNNKGDKNG